MARMEQAAGVSALFDAGPQAIVASQKRMELHTRLEEQSAAVITYINAHEKNSDDTNA